MAIAKSADMNWKSYLRLLAEQGCKVSDLEKTELAGLLMRRDNENVRHSNELFEHIFAMDNGEITDRIATLLFSESPDSITDLVQILKAQITQAYQDEINTLIDGEFQSYEEERKERLSRENPNDEYCPDKHHYDESMICKL